MHYRPEIDGLRAVTIVPVILFHAGFEVFNGGFVGVDVFFVISGYLITGIILFDMDRGRFSLINFYERRARRILPALFFIMVVCIPFAWMWLIPPDMKDFAQSLVAVSTFSSNILFWKEAGYFATAAELKPLLHTWSLAVEEQFYIIFPLFLLLAWRLGKRWILGAFAVVFVLSLGAGNWSAYNQPVAAFYLFPTRGWEILLGAFAAVYFNRYDTIHVSGPIGNALGVLGLGLIVWSIFAFDKSTPFPGLYALVPTIGALLVILFAHNGTIAQRILSNKLLVGVGLISYSAYLWHQPLFAFARHRSITEPSVMLMVTLCAVSIPLAYCSWRFVEQPFRNRKGFSRNFIFASATTVATVFIVLGLAGHYTKGFQKSFLLRFEAGLRPVIEQFLFANDYVPRRWEKTGLRDFSDTGDRLKVVLIGDSFGQDIFNAVYETDLADRYFLSVYHIPAGCGNLFTEMDLMPFIKAKSRSRCAQHDYYRNDKLLRLIREADEVWLGSDWLEWTVKLLPQSLKAIARHTNAKIRVFGRKNFGTEVNLKHYLYAQENDNKRFKGVLRESHISINKLMRSTLPKGVFIDISFLLCRSETTCVNTIDDGFIISYDGNHLTKVGAKLLGTLLKPILLPNK